MVPAVSSCCEHERTVQISFLLRIRSTPIPLLSSPNHLLAGDPDHTSQLHLSAVMIVVTVVGPILLIPLVLPRQLLCVLDELLKPGRLALPAANMQSKCCFYAPLASCP